MVYDEDYWREYHERQEYEHRLAEAAYEEESMERDWNCLQIADAWNNGDLSLQQAQNYLANYGESDRLGHWAIEAAKIGKHQPLDDAPY